MKKLSMALFMVFFSVGQLFAFGVPSFGGKSAESPTISIEDAMASQSSFVASYVTGNVLDLETKSLLAEALGLDDQANELRVAAKSMNEGNAKDIAATVAKTEAATKAVDEKMKDSGDLSGDAKKKVAESLLTLTGCVVAYKTAAELAPSALESAQSVVKSASLMDAMSIKNKLGPVLTIAPKIPGDLSSIVTTASKYVEFARNSGVKPPSNLMSALGDL